MHVHILGWGVFGCSCVGARLHTFLGSWITTCGDLSTVRLKKTTLDYRENGRPATCSVQTTSPRHDFSSDYESWTSVQFRLQVLYTTSVLDTTSVLNTWLQRKWIPCHRLKKTLRGPSWPPEPRRTVLLSYSASSERQAKREPWDASTWVADSGGEWWAADAMETESAQKSGVTSGSPSERSAPHDHVCDRYLTFEW
jgi:hypothetical protein